MNAAAIATRPTMRGLLLRAALLVAAAAALLALGCGDGGLARTPMVDDPFSGGYPTYRDDDSGITAILGTPDLGVGTHRVAFTLSDREGLVRLPAVDVRTHYLDEGATAAEGARQVTSASFAEFPDGTRGLFIAPLEFDRAGEWGLEVSVPRGDGSTATLLLAFPVAEEASAPVVGEPAPPSVHRTARDVESLHELTTGSAPVPALYEQTVAEALEAERPFLVVFASPAFCTNPLCGPQVEEAGELWEEYGDRMTFIHVDLYENPHEIQGDLDRAVRTPVLEEWGLHTDEWTFIVGADGLVQARFESFVPRDELAAALDEVIEAEATTARAPAAGAR
ncbi:MAG: hypothetical protein WD734_06730 [Dehalococcoidia bacterium]